MEKVAILLMCIGIVYPIIFLPLYIYKGNKDFKVTNDVKQFWFISMFMITSGGIIYPTFGVYFLLIFPVFIVLTKHLINEINWKIYVIYILDSNRIVINNILNGK